VSDPSPDPLRDSASEQTSTGSEEATPPQPPPSETAALPDAAAEEAPLSPRYHSPREALLLLVACFGLHVLVEASTGWGDVARDMAPALQVLVWIVPAYWLLQHRGEDPWLRHGLTSSPRGLLPALGISLGILGAFVAVCALLADGPARPVAWSGLLRLLPEQLVFVALKEEYFFRGVLQPALERRGGPARRILGAPLGRGAIAAAALFALAHLDPVQGIDATRLLTFFPALWFAWLRARTGSIVPAILGHTAANVVGQACLQAFGVGFA
jgi:membrane protease YdiL (CAAX protease family)